ncbi:MAG: flavodoxin family protein, partial [Lachnospiraceae bacterium]|nr:flavodoxin family protein [Lachnospiraceae bacterium]
ILGSPTYASNVSGQMKVIIDRGHFVMEQLLYGKYVISVTTYENYGGMDSAKILNRLLSYSGAKISGTIVLQNKFNLNPLEAIRLKERIEKVVYRFHRDVVAKRKYMFQSIKHLIIFRIGIQPFVMKKGSQYDGVITHWKKRNIAGGHK